MIKAIIFDLDGVLVDTKKIHFEAFNKALQTAGLGSYVLSFEEHLRDYDGLPTSVKMEKMGIHPSVRKAVSELKQAFTLDTYKTFTTDDKLVSLIESLLREGYKIGVVTNSVGETTRAILKRIGILEGLDAVITNEWGRPKPAPDLYLRAFLELEVRPKECLVFEDSPKGLQAALDSGANVHTVKHPSELSYENIMSAINHTSPNQTPWIDKELTVLIPMAGQGSRFERAGYSFPKPLIDIKGKTMIQCVVESLNIKANYVYLVQKSHNVKYNLQTVLNLITPGCKVVEVDGLTEGSACTTLLAKDLINNDKPLLIANSDQIVDWNSSEFMYRMTQSGVDAGILTFPNAHVKWSYAEVEGGYVKRVAEKLPISNNATVGIYWYKRGADYVKYAEQMIARNIRTNNEFYICPIFNEFIEDGKKIVIHEIPAEAMHGTGTPEDLENYLSHLNRKTS